MIDKKLRAIVWRCILMGCVAFWIGLALYCRCGGDEALKSAKRTFSAAGFEVVGRIVLKNGRTEKIYK